MYGYKTDSDWTRNKNSVSIIYPNADGSFTEITLSQFLEESAENTAEKFYAIKELSDKFFQDEDNAESNRAKNELPLYDWSEKYISETLEEQLIESLEQKNHQAYLKRREQMLALVPDVLDKLTETQRKRFLLHKVKNLTTRKIAEIEKVSQQSVCESINSAEKKIEKYLRNITENSEKHPVKTED